MTTDTNSELKDLKELINTKFEQLDKKLDIYIARSDERLKAIEGRLDTMQASVNKIPELAEKVGELKNWRQIALIVLTGTFGSIFGWVLRGGRIP
ncbi:hypothetical protein [Gloeothece verrucosa]|uniref:Uncharacterized protein n=1 Tax=Gloeothece verrucosa (strain PCC 7822) TaxID=497965 RepID=E0ULZ1_GLOV7|nr:hypothetical protein [Gloeothece verrucosa]ADN17971.1 conserved hypothetical protein [Gloeothece verrucosa PCC 7822]